MTPESVRGGFITPEDLLILDKVKKVIESLPDLELPTDLSCHILARAIQIVFSQDGLRVVDGHFHLSYRHSWLKLLSGNILDVYPVGIAGGPFVVDSQGGYLSPGTRLYKAATVEESARWFEEFESIPFRQTLGVVSLTLQCIIMGTPPPTLMVIQAE